MKFPIRKIIEIGNKKGAENPIKESTIMSHIFFLVNP
jgi:hypothetical protein